MLDAAHNAGPIVMAVGGRHVVAVVCTHAHNDRVTVAPELGEALDAPALVHPRDDVLWRIPSARAAANRAVHAGIHHPPRDPAWRGAATSTLALTASALRQPTSARSRNRNVGVGRRLPNSLTCRGALTSRLVTLSPRWRTLELHGCAVCSATAGGSESAGYRRLRRWRVRGGLQRRRLDAHRGGFSGAAAAPVRASGIVRRMCGDA